MNMLQAVLLLGMAVVFSGVAEAGEACPDAVATGSSNVTVEGKQAARAGDKSACAGTAVE
ncbi:MAG: PAAR domain-containing protein, partial [Parvibaculaceae bacterium]